MQPVANNQQRSEHNRQGQGSDIERGQQDGTDENADRSTACLVGGSSVVTVAGVESLVGMITLTLRR